MHLFVYLAAAAEGLAQLQMLINLNYLVCARVEGVAVHPSSQRGVVGRFIEKWTGHMSILDFHHLSCRFGHWFGILKLMRIEL